MERRRTRLVRLASTASDSAEEVPREENAPNEVSSVLTLIAVRAKHDQRIELS